MFICVFSLPAALEALSEKYCDAVHQHQETKKD
jgi:hypothetical protein